MYRRDGAECELAFVAAFERHDGIGTLLLEALREAVVAASGSGSSRRTTTSMRSASTSGAGFAWWCSDRAPSTMRVRTLKPHIGLLGDFGIPLRDELELELPLEPARSGER